MDTEQQAEAGRLERLWRRAVWLEALHRYQVCWWASRLDAGTWSLVLYYVIGGR